MVNERFLTDLFRATFPRDYCHLFRENHFCEVLLTLRLSVFFFARETLYISHLKKWEFLFLKT